MFTLGCRLELIYGWQGMMECIEYHIKNQASAGEVLQILEAGCGKSWTINLNGVEYYLTGVDLDKDALEIRKNITKDLDEFIEGDLRTVELKENQYDVIYNAYVLEHINGAEQVLNNFVRWLKPAGIMIISIPDPDSVYGFISRITPHWFHLLYYRLFVNYKKAGKSGYGPYPVCYDSVVSRKGIRNYCDNNNVNVLAEYGYAPKIIGFVTLLLHLFNKIVSVLSFGLLSSRHKNLLYVLQKQESVQQSAVEARHS